MTQIAKLFVFVTAWIFIPSLTFAHQNDSPAGYWKTIDDITGKEQSILKLSEIDHGSIIGTVVKNLSPQLAHYKVCSKCQGEKHNKPIIGMVIMWGFEWNGKEWKGGRILDPTSGKIYRCKLKVVNNGHQLMVHGYIGIPLLGRTQTWQRVNSL